MQQYHSQGKKKKTHKIIFSLISCLPNLLYLPLQAWKHWREGTASNIIDPTLRDITTTEIIRCIHIGLLCVQENAANRPTMALIVVLLNSYSITLSAPSQPAFFMHSNIESYTSRRENNSEVIGSYLSKGNSVQYSANDQASITELYPR